MSGSNDGITRAPRRPAIAPALSRSDLDRDYLSRVGGIPALLEDPRTRLVVLHEGRALGTAAGALALVDPGTVAVDPDTAVFLGRARTASDGLAEGAAVLALTVSDADAGTLGADGTWLDLRRVGSLLEPRDAGLFTQALALANWHGAAAFSPATGEPTTIAQAGWVRIDPSTGRENFPRTDPAVIVAVLDDDDRILLGSNVEWDTGRFSLLAGFVEPGSRSRRRSSARSTRRPASWWPTRSIAGASPGRSRRRSCWASRHTSPPARRVSRGLTAPNCESCGGSRVSSSGRRSRPAA
ncbi:hypothetical protein GCM10025869_01840 [Homoserinibacter gongjuensis]|uniref:NADH pyrophosphatase-like N-terminal domain-containing protein n=1 Tax=Homoserinibacter gongjuensis TaxID=1162968 RepID=A0ABQ6JMZ1_9MICO|nr:hypothetical protein GCM10025869_01840 [Homoserinibacter gongjuensis]